jgi:hypothetical protein
LAAVTATNEERRDREAAEPTFLSAVACFAACGVRSLLPRPAAAHPVPFSYVDLRLQPGAIEGTVVAHIFDLAHDLNIVPAERLLDPAVAAQQSAAIARLFTARLTVTPTASR